MNAMSNDPQNSPLKQDLEHITQEMYKKNLELAERNKTLSLLRRIDEIVLGSATDVTEFAKKIIDTLITDGDSRAVALYLLDRESNTLNHLAFSQTEAELRAESEVNKKIYAETIPVTISENLMVIALNEKKFQTTSKLYDILLTGFSENDAVKIQEILGISQLLIYPLIVRDTVVGIMVVGTDEKDELLAAFRRDLLDRVAATVGIAIDNALLYKNIEAANEQLKQLDKLKDEFVSLASHELRTPMTAIKSYIWMLIENKMVQDPKGSEYLHHAYESADRLITLVNDMLNVSRIESGRMVLTKEPVSLSRLIADVVSEIKPVSDKQHITINQNISETIPDISADKNKLKEVLINLLGNSLKFTPENGSITITLSHEGNSAFVRIVDTGKGIEAEDLPKLFTKFGMIEKNYDNPQTQQGTGLGLYICKAIIELHGGAISVSSGGRDLGSTFSFTIPLNL